MTGVPGYACPGGAYVFAGPSLYYQAAPKGDFELRPPVKAGDLVAIPALAGGGSLVVVVDGEFGQSLSVPISELRAILEAGNTIVGCSSMGALRAVECAPLGMAGRGWVFEQYRSGRINDDGEVALSYDPESYRPFSVPLVNWRWLLASMVEASELSAELARELLGAAADVFYRERTVPCLRRLVAASSASAKDHDRLMSKLEPSRLGEWDRKCLDALETLGEVLSSRTTPAEVLLP
ncbi:MAG TPA: TfuA-like protein [Acidimicrobiales bacterium]|nr:TfuA-like protein [Acidimicrobiales bacterium]